MIIHAKAFSVFISIFLLLVPCHAEKAYSTKERELNPSAIRSVRDTKENREKTKTLFRTVGVIAMVGGGFGAYLYHAESEEQFERYNASAFTQNTDKYRERVEWLDRAKWICLGVGGAGGAAFAVTFTF